MPNNSSLSPSGQPPSFEKRLPLALGLMMLVLLGSQYFFKPAPGPKPAQNIAPKIAAQETAQPPAPAPAARVSGQVEAAAETLTQIDTGLYHVVFTNRGAAVKSWVLKKYTDEAGKPLQLVSEAAHTQGLPQPFSIETKDRKLTFNPNDVLYLPAVSSDGLGVDYTYSDGKTAITKSFHFGKDTYLADVKSSVTEGSSPVPHFLVWRGGFGDPRAFKASATERSVRYDWALGS